RPPSRRRFAPPQDEVLLFLRPHGEEPRSGVSNHAPQSGMVFLVRHSGGGPGVRRSLKSGLMVRSRAAASRTMRHRVEWLFWSGTREEGLVCGAASSPALMVRSREAASRTMGLGRRVVTTPL